MVSKDVQGFFHVNVNCTNFAQSLAFYQLVGFEKILDFDDAPGPVRSFGQAGLGPVLGLPDDCDGRAALLALSGESGSTRLDLIEWKQPKLPAERRKSSCPAGHRAYLPQDQRLRQRLFQTVFRRLRRL